MSDIPGGRRVASRPDDSVAPVENPADVPGAGRGRGRGGRRGPQQSQVGLESPPVVKGSPRSSPDSEKKLVEKMTALKLVDRPDRGGSAGRKINLIVNLFQIKAKLPFTVHMYYVEAKSEQFRLIREEESVVFWACVRQYGGTVFPNPSTMIFDGHSLCFSLQQLQFPDNQTSAYNFSDVEVQLERDNRPKKFSLIIQYSGPIEVNMEEPATTDLIERRTTPIQIIELIYKQSHTCPYSHSDFVKFASSFYLKPYRNGNGNGNGAAHLYPSIPNYDIYCPMNIGKGREVWHGYYCSARVLTGHQLWLNVNSAVGVYYKCQSVLNFACEILQTDPRQLTGDATLTPMQIKMIEKELKGLKVRPLPKEEGVPTAQRSGTFKVVGITTESVSELTFVIRREGIEPVTTTVADYFNGDNRPIRFPRLPAVQIGKQNRFMPLEWCIIEKGQKVRKKLDEMMTAKIIREAAVSAPQRLQNIMKMVQQAQLPKDGFAAKFGMEMSGNPARVTGRVLQPPRMLYGNGKIVEPSRGVWQAGPGQIFSMLKPARIGSYALVAFGQRGRLEQMLMNFCTQLHRTATRMGIQMPQWPDRVEYLNGLEAVEPIMKQLAEEGKPPELTVVMLPAKNSPFYPEVKRVAEILVDLMTQCVTFQVVQQSKENVLENLLLKINMKMGGQNNSVGPDERLFRSIMEKDGGTLVVGIDLTHPGPRDERSPSIAAVVANVDDKAFTYRASVKIQKHRREALVYVNNAVHERLVDYYRHSKKKPSQIIVFRDGVDTGQFRHVLSEELDGIKTACMSLSSDYRPKITYVVVQKRHHVRMFVENERDGVGKAVNVPPGTCLDTELVEPIAFDYYLASQFGIQGTSVPAHYHILYDENNFSSDQLESFTFALTHLYGRCPRSVKVPAPTYFADLVCRRAHAHLMKLIGDVGDTASVSSGQAATQSSSLSEPTLIAATTVREKIRSAMYFA